MNVRIATYNLFEGANGSYNRLIEFIREIKLDVLCLQEINDWQDNDFSRLKDFTDRILFTSFAFGNSNTEYKLATLGKHPILGRNLHAEAFWHAALETRMQFADTEVAVYNIHLDPWQESSREKEIARLIATVDPKRPTIITGDFNSLSRQDNYPPELLAQLQSKGISKYGTNALEYSVVDRLLNAGFVDVSAAANNFEPTVPSAFSTDKDHEVPVRVDYMFVSPDLAPRVKRVERVKTDLTDTISDHYPVVVTFTFGAEEPDEAKQAAPAQPEPPKEPEPQEFSSKPLHMYGEEPPSPPPPPPPPKPDKPEAKDGADGEVVVWTHNQS